MTSLEAEWALWGLPADGGAGYAVLARSDGRLRGAHFEKIITRFSPGTPDTDGALPRVTIGAVDISKVPHLAVALQTPRPVQEGQGVTTRLFVFPYSVLSSEPVGYLGLYRHLAAADLPESGTGSPVTVRPPALDTTSVAADLQELGPGPAFAATLLVRDQNVCVVQAESTSLDERLRYLDAVAALLPYGYRARLTATTWANSATRHPFRLFFARHAGSNALGVPLRGSAMLPGEPDTEQEHLRPLKAALDRLGAEEVIRSFLKDPAPRFCDDPGPAVRAVQAMTAPPRPLPEDAGLTELRDLFGRRESVLAMDRGTARAAMSRLVELAEPQDWPTIDVWWAELAGDDLVGLLTPAFERCHARLWSGEPGRIQTQLLIAYRYDQGDDFLAALVVPPRMSRERIENGLAATAQLVHESVIACDAADAHPRTLRSLVDQPQVMCELVAQLATSDRARLARGLGWLATARAKDPRVLAVLRDVLTSREPDPLPSERLRGLAESGRGCVAALLDAACAVGRLPLVLRAFVELMIEGGTIPPEEDRYWADRVGDLRASDPQVQGAIDVLLLAFGGRPDIAGGLAGDADGSYRRGFLGTCGLPWPKGRGPAAAIAALLDDQGGRRDARRPRGRPVPPLQELLALALDPAAHGPAGEDADAIVDGLVAGHRRGMTAGRCLDGLTPGTWTPALAVTVASRLEPALVGQGAALRTAREWSAALVGHIVSGARGQDLARDFPARLAEHVAADLEGRLSLLRAVASGDRARRDLVRVQTLLDQVVKTISTDGGGTGGP
ncbi:hypothetical protein AGRA3207_002042 [Actinomadura graeca]|uniref:Uncharacterized protein n=1 Tax=Actinomadura graeca TaxID=2750812 RepID=A0ABX8QRC1_9ACTN|nr:hypothetical protein [Actinomadura graeca]QXJ21210.1 hypothetical protein AGRA3207_002042 [Actinomadura graeca]